MMKTLFYPWPIDRSYRGPELKNNHLRIVRTLLLILLVALLVPYLVTPFYRTGHPVSTLMIWRTLTGAPISRQWIDLAAISPMLPRAVVAAGDAKFCRPHALDWAALRRLALTYGARAQAVELQRCWSENRAF